MELLADVCFCLLLVLAYHNSIKQQLSCETESAASTVGSRPHLASAIRTRFVNVLWLRRSRCRLASSPASDRTNFSSFRPTTPTLSRNTFFRTAWNPLPTAKHNRIAKSSVLTTHTTGLQIFSSVSAPAYQDETWRLLPVSPMVM